MRIFISKFKLNVDLVLFQVKWLEENCRTKTNIKPQVHLIDIKIINLVKDIINIKVLNITKDITLVSRLTVSP